ncbi:hypothetical protein LZ32DRAFT_100732 [Colletotrichum eremochloae]|nr:hypothetical protein LZ32DRAFT_100732 [Colletotrichum eremochloae]
MRRICISSHGGTTRRNQSFGGKGVTDVKCVSRKSSCAETQIFPKGHIHSSKNDCPVFWFTLMILPLVLPLFHSGLLSSRSFLTQRPGTPVKARSPVDTYNYPTFSSNVVSSSPSSWFS